MDGTERLHVSEYGSRLFDANGHLFASVNSFDRTDGQNRAIALRLVALWNACRGIPTEALEAVANQPDDLARMNALARVPFPQEAV